MKKLLLFLFFTVTVNMICSQTTVTIGTGTATQKQPFGMWASYERSAAIYLASEIGSFGSYGLIINTLGWNVGTGDPTVCPTKIYLKTTTGANFTGATWASMTNGATLVYNASTNFPAAGWHTIDIADFVYPTANLLVLCETNYGGSGATFYPIFKYSYFPGKHQYWQEYDNPPLGNGTVNENRPNIQINYTVLTNPVVPPSGFMATAGSSTQVILNWKKNAANDNVMIAFNDSAIFGTPTGNYSTGNNIVGGGTVIYSGPGTTFTQTSGLMPGTTYYYKAWSVHTPGPAYSIGTGSTATTLCDITSVFPAVTDFEVLFFPPSCWSNSGLPWSRSGAASGYGTGSASAFADFYTTSSGDFEIVSPQLDFGLLGSPTVTFDHAYATYDTQVDKLELLYSINNGNTFTLLETWLGGISGPLNTGGATTSSFVPNPDQWATKSRLLPDGTNKVMFRGISGYGNNLFLDNITFSGNCLPPGMLVVSNITSTSADLGWTPSGVSGTWHVSWGLSGFDTVAGGTLITGITYHPYTLGGLQPGETYDFYVRTDCGGGVSYWEGPLSFSTACETLNIPYFESFDYITPPGTGCLEVTDNNGDATEWVTSSNEPLSYPNSMYLVQNASQASDDWFFSPGILLYEGTPYAVNFAYRGNGAGLPECLEVKWGNAPIASAMTGGQLWNDQAIQSSAYLYGAASLLPGTTGIYYLGWHGYSPAGEGFLCVDDISMDVGLVSWAGSSSPDWEDPMNWIPAAVPGGFQNVIIPSGTLYSPAINMTGIECKDLEIDIGAVLTINSTAELTVYGNITIRETATLDNQGLVILKGNLDNQNPE